MQWVIKTSKLCNLSCKYCYEWEHLSRAPALLISRLVSWVDDLWCRAIGAGV
ncbi:hypothetical protein YM3MPS_28640 [Mycobacterium pseudoshottsii]|nr:putative oxidoreductase [Mycobacterium pseudoshottsii]RFZ70089.1 hypothetical protein DL240490_01273 [Mycobacterium marinum]BEH77061.1 hypothetical protein YM3MPS_28640 [Mycobacterium pseudoshottsii]